jgi:hypothetical protein
VNQKARWGGLIDILLLAICAVASVSTRVDLLECADLVSALVFGDLSPPSRRPASNGRWDCGDRSPNTKAVTGYRTPKSMLLTVLCIYLPRLLAAPTDLGR